METIHLKSLTMSIFFFTLLLREFTAFDIGLISTCITPYNQSVNNLTHLHDTSFETTLQTLFSILASSSSSYSYSTAVQPPSEMAYGRYLCRGDASSRDCRSCVKTITDAAMSSVTLHPCKESFSYMDKCMIHFANYSFFGKSDNVDIPLVVGNCSETDVQEYNRTLQGTLKGAINDAVLFNSTAWFATREAETASGTQEKVYALAQCSQELDRQTCSGCLNAALVAVSNLTCKSAAALLASCQLRYDNVSFYSSAMSNSPTVFSAFLVATWSLFLIHLLLG